MVSTIIMNRPCFLVIDREFPGSISTRKLVIETAKFNVLTAYSGQEALEVFGRFPNVSGVVLDGALEDVSCAKVAATLKSMNPAIPIVVISAPGSPEVAEADYLVETFEPRKLLEVLQGLQPKEAKEIEQRNEDLSRQKYE